MVGWVTLASGVLYFARETAHGVELQKAKTKRPGNISPTAAHTNNSTHQSIVHRDNEEKIYHQSIKQQIQSNTLPRCKMQATFMPIIVVLSAPSFFYSLSTSVPEHNSLGIDINMLRAFDYIAPLIFVLIESIVLPQLALKVEVLYLDPKSDTKPGSNATTLCGIANLFLFWYAVLESCTCEFTEPTYLPIGLCQYLRR